MLQNEINEKLIRAINLSDFEEIENFLQQGADINAVDKDGNSPLLSEINSSNPRLSIVQLLLEKGADVNMASTTYTSSTFNSGSVFFGEGNNNGLYLYLNFLKQRELNNLRTLGSGGDEAA